MNVNKISFDGELTWTDFNDKKLQCFDNISPQLYNIVFGSPGGCTKSENLDSSVAIGNSLSLCANGDFENGNFSGYTFGTAFNNEDPDGPHILNDVFDPKVHKIVNVDSIVGNLII